DAARRAPEADVVRAGVEVEALYQAAWDHAAADHEVKQLRHAHTVEVEGAVARVGAADHEQRQTRDRRGDARQHADHPKRIAERAGRVVQLLVAQHDPIALVTRLVAVHDAVVARTWLVVAGGAAGEGEHADQDAPARDPAHRPERTADRRRRL